MPGKAAQQAWLESTREQAAGAREWFVSSEDGLVSASIVREAPPRKPGSTDAPLYRVRMVCRSSMGVGEMQLTWSPQPQTGRTMTVSVDGNAPVEYKIEGTESMGNGGTAQTGHASVLLSSGRGGKLGLANQSLTIRELFPSETVEFPFSGLDQKARAELRQCFSKRWREGLRSPVPVPRLSGALSGSSSRCPTSTLCIGVMIPAS